MKNNWLHSIRPLPVALFFACIGVQIPLWVGEKSWPHVWQLEGQVGRADAANQVRREHNAELEAEVRDLSQGLRAIEEAARYESALMKPGERFVQYVVPGTEPKQTGGWTKDGVPKAVAVPGRGH